MQIDKAMSELIKNPKAIIELKGQGFRSDMRIRNLENGVCFEYWNEEYKTYDLLAFRIPFDGWTGGDKNE